MAAKFCAFSNSIMPFSSLCRQPSVGKLFDQTFTIYKHGTGLRSRHCHHMQRNYFGTFTSLNSTGVLSRPAAGFSVRSVLSLSQSLLSNHAVQSPWKASYVRPLSTSTVNLRGLANKQLESTDGKDKSDHSNWTTHLSAENNYLSWCRNVYIASIVGITIQLQHIPYSQEVASVFFLMAALNLSYGTMSYILNVVRLKSSVGMSVLGVLISVCMSLLHMMLWFSAVMIYLGYLPDDDDDDGPNGGSGGGPDVKKRGVIIEFKPGKA